GPDFAIPSAASLAGIPITRTRPLLAELARAHLIAEPNPGRYTCHDLLRAYAAEQTHTHDTADQRAAAVHRMLDHYLHTAHTAAMALDPLRKPITLTPPQPGIVTVDLAEHAEALTWFVTEHPVLLAAITQAADTGFDTHTWQLAWTLADFHDRQARWLDKAAVQHTALAAARRLADPAAQAIIHRCLAVAYGRMDRHDDAYIQLEYALDLACQAGDLIGQAFTHHNLGSVRAGQGRHDDALAHAAQALDLFRAADYPSGQARALNGIGWLHAETGDHHGALAPCHQALTLLQELDDQEGQAATWETLGYAHH